MGRSKSNTGIGLIDNPVNAMVNEGTNKMAKNVEKSIQKAGQIGGNIISGDFNNMGSNLTTLGLITITAGTANQDDYQRIAGESGDARKIREMGDAAKAEEAEAAAAVEAENVRQQTAQISGIIAARKRSPGRAQTLISTKPSINTLLSLN